MNKRHLLIILLLFTVLIILRHIAPKSLDWELSFSGYKKSPYGCKVAKDLLNIIFQGEKIHINTGSFYITLPDSLSSSNIIIISDHFNPDNLDLEKLLAFTAKGNNLFISSLSFPDKLHDTLKFKTQESVIDTSIFKKYTERLCLSYPVDQKGNVFNFLRRMPDHYFTNYNTSSCTVLGTDRAGRADFIKVRFGKGNIYLHCQPLAFTNYHILYGNYQYACLALSALPAVNTIWDQYYKPDRFIDNSPVRYILSQAPLRSAYYVILVALLTYMVSGTRRIQRLIPLIQPLQNASLDFIRSIGQLYYKSQNHSDLAKKKIYYFNEFLKNRYHIQQPYTSEEQAKILSQKSGISRDFINSLAALTGNVEKKDTVNRHELINLHQMIEKFYSECK